MAYEEILARMKNEYRALAGFDADDASDIGIRLKALAAELAAFYARLGELEKQIVPLTSTGAYLDCHAEAKGIFRKPALKAAGTLRFSRETAAASDIAIPAGIVCAVSGDGQVMYVTTEDARLPAGESFVDIAAEAELPGEAGNAAARAINVMITPAAGITAVENAAAFTGGAAQEGDEALRERLLFSYANLSNGTNAAYYYDAAMSHKEVTCANVLPRSRGRGTVDVVIKCTGEGVSPATVSELQALFDREKEINVDARVMEASSRAFDVEAEITMRSGYLESEVIANVRRGIQDYFNGAEIGKTLYRTELGGRISAAEGVATYEILEPRADYAMTGTQVMDYGSITLSVRAVV
jgi:uncharacterized phage protein gp47/JayE